MRRIDTQEFKDRVSLTMAQHEEANHYKAILTTHGYTYIMSIYGVVYNKDKLRYEFRRVEVYSNKPFDYVNFLLVTNFLKEFLPLNYYSLYAYNLDKQEVILVEGWD